MPKKQRKYIKIRGANEHNLKCIDVDIPRDEFVVLTGLSGSGKSSLAFDTIYAEGQRRYMESLSSYARQFLGQMEKPDVESIEGLPPAISIDQKSTNRNPRSTVGTVTEIYDYFRLLYARIGIPHCPKCGRAIEKQTIDQMVDAVMKLPERTVATLAGEASRLAEAVVTGEEKSYSTADRRLDKVLTGRRWGIPIMLGLLAVIFWLTISGANLPSALLAKGLFRLQDLLSGALLGLGVPLWLHDALILGVYRVAAWVVSVMLPPMAIFFPLFTLLEDMGYLPRVAYNLDRPLKRCGACGKQALTICMGFGCNAAGVVGCRIIDSPRERLLAILTNSFVPCNGRFPTLVNLILLFFVGTAAGPGQSVLSALLLTGFILLGAAATFAVTGLLSRTVLRGVPSSFTLELPPYRRPQWGQVIVRSVFDRTLFVLARAVKAAAPAGLLLWLMANLTIGGSTILAHCAGFLEPAGRALGMDGVILLAFLLGLPANEIVVPIMLMGYLSQGVLQQPEGLAQMQGVFLANGWTPVTALCVMLFMLMHWPCATTLMTIRKETGSLKWTLLAAALPTLCGTLACLLVNGLYRLVT